MTSQAGLQEHSTRVRGDRVLEVSEVGLSFGGVRALEAVSFDVYENSVLGVIGPNGAGKTALLNSICGVYRPQVGAIRFRGQVILGRRPEHVARFGIGRTFQGMDHFNDFSVINYVLLGRTPLLGRSAWGAALALPATDRREKIQRQAADAVLERCGLLEYRDEPLHEVPYGIQKQVDMARIIASDCQVVLLDEPTSGTTSAERDIISASLNMLAETGMAVVLIDHDVQFVTRHCDRLVALNYGQLLAQGSVDEVFSHSRVREVFLGIAT